jgi:hypothetical protein
MYDMEWVPVKCSCKGPSNKHNFINNNGTALQPKCIKLYRILHNRNLIFKNNFNIWGPRGSVVVKALSYKPEGGGFDTR